MVKRIVFVTLAVLMIVGLCSGAARAAIPNNISFQGRLTDSAGKPIAGIEQIKFDIYDDATAVKEPLMTETMLNIKVDSNGVFNVLLGTDEKAAEQLNLMRFDKPYWVEITVNNVKLSPRQPLVSVPYAFTAKNLSPGNKAIAGNLLVLGGIGAGPIISLGTGNTILGTTTSQNKINYAVGGVASSPADAVRGSNLGSGAGVSGMSAAGIGVYGKGSPAGKFDGDVEITSNKGVMLNAVNRPLITRGWNKFTSGNYAGVGKWGLFMEPNILTFGIPNVAGKYFQFAAYDDDSTPNTLLSIDINGNYFGGGAGKNQGVKLNAYNGPMITRGYDKFVGAPAKYTGLGRWGLFMEPNRLTLGYPNISGKAVDFAEYGEDGKAYPVATISRKGIATVGNWGVMNVPFKLQSFDVGDIEPGLAKAKTISWEDKRKVYILSSMWFFGNNTWYSGEGDFDLSYDEYAGNIHVYNKTSWTRQKVKVTVIYGE